MAWTMRNRVRRTVVGRTSAAPWGDTIIRSATGSFINQSFYDYNPYISEFTLEHTSDVDRKVHPRSKGSKDEGGPFYQKKITMLAQPVEMDINWSMKVTSSGRIETGRGSTMAVLSHSLVNPLYNPNLQALNTRFSSIAFPSIPLHTYGAKAMNRLDPTRGIAPDPLQFLGELVFEGLPSIPLKLFARVKNVKHAVSLKSGGSEYLNAVFGWRPLVSDIIDMIQLYKDIDKKLAQLRKDNGKSVRRTGTLHHSRVTTRNPLGGAAGSGIPPFSKPGFALTAGGAHAELPAMPAELVTVTEERVWFAGKGSYILPIDLLTAPSDIEGLIKILKSVPSPATVYELIPWSWLIDWFSNLGDIIQNQAGSGIGEYTMDYCYLMRKRTVTTYYECPGSLRYAQIPYPNGTPRFVQSQRDLRTIVVEETKERVAATPFGFGLTLAELSPRQVAILTALGLSRQNFV